MKYDSPEEKQQIRIEVKKLLAEHDMKLSEYCRKFDLDYDVVYGNIYTYAAIQHNFVNDFVQRLDKTKSLQNFNGKFVIARP